MLIASICISLMTFTSDSGALVSDTIAARSDGSSVVVVKQGWTPQPDGRGTLDILWSCGFTMFLCSWSILCLNTPGPHETKLKVLWRKLAMTTLGILCPELIFELACGQWLSARRSVEQFNQRCHGIRHKQDRRSRLASIKNKVTADIETLQNQSAEDWNMEKAFFTEMGGFRLHTRDQRPFPIDSKQLFYLVEKGYVNFPNVKLRVIQDKNKVDGLLRAVVLCQVLWFLVGVIARWIQRLAVTTAELTTVSFIFCSAGTALCWWHKPADVVTTETIYTDACWNEILQDADQPFGEWRLSPLDFISRKEWWWSKSWMNFVNILNHMHITFGPTYRPAIASQTPNRKSCQSKPCFRSWVSRTASLRSCSSAGTIVFPLELSSYFGGRRA